MKKFASLIVLVFTLLSNLQVGVLYANSTSDLKKEKQKSVLILDELSTTIESSVKKIKENTKNKNTQQRLGEKHNEVKKYIISAEESVDLANSISNIEEILTKTKKVVTLKVVSGKTKQIDMRKSIGGDTANTPKKKKNAFNAIIRSIDKGNDYSLIIRTEYEQTQATGLFNEYDEKVRLKFLYSDEGNNYFEVILSKKSIFSEEMLEDIQNGNIPESFLGIEIITPEVFAVNDIDLSGEDVSKTWGVQKYNTVDYLEKLQATGKKIRVGVIDTGIDYNHPDLQGRVSGGYDFVNDDNDALDDQGHGTHVSGTIGASINGGGIIGVNPYVEFVPLKICDANGFCPSYGVIKALEYAKTEKIEVLNMSLGGRGIPDSHPICSGISSVVQSGGIIIAASGNSNIDTAEFVPGGCSDAITVAAVDSTGNRAAFSNYGSKVDVSAPGVEIYSTSLENGYIKMSGTSMATPHIVGLVSIMKSFDSGIDSQKVKELFKKYPLSVSSETGKDIADAVDVDSLVAGLTSSVSVAPIVKEEAPTLGGEKNEEVKDDAQIKSDIQFIENQEIYRGPTDSTSKRSFDLEPLDDLRPAYAFLDLGMSGSGVQINSLDIQEENIITESINEKVVDKKDLGGESKGIQYFGENGTVSEDELGVNNVEDLEENFDENEKKVQEYFIDGAEKRIEINAVGEEVLKKVELLKYNNGIKKNTEASKKDKKGFSEIKKEKNDIEELYHTEELIIDDAKKGIEVNSIGESPEEIVVLSEEELTDFNSEGQVLGEVDEGEWEEITLTEENLQELGNQTEVLIDGAQKIEGIQINNLNEIEVEEYSSGFLKEQGDEDLTDIEVPDLTPEEKKLLEEKYGVLDTNIKVIPELGLLTSEEVGKIENQEQTAKNGAEIESGVEINSIGIESLLSENVVLDLGKILTIPTTIQGLFQFTHSNWGVVRAYQSGRNIYIEAKKEGVTSIDIISEGVHQGTIDIEVKKPVIEKTLYIGDTYNQHLYYAYTCQYDVSDESLVDISTAYSNYIVTAKKAGTLYLDVHSCFTGKYNPEYILKLNIKNIPQPQVYDLTVNQGENLDFYFPSKSTYTFSAEYLDSGRARVYGQNGYVSVYGDIFGNIKYRVFGSDLRFPLYILNIKIVPKVTVQAKEVYIGKELLIEELEGSTFTIQNGAIADTYISGITLKFYGRQSGDVEIYVHRAGYHYITYKVHIKPLPVVQEYSATIVEGKSTQLYIPTLAGGNVYTYTNVNGGSTILTHSNGILTLTGGNVGTLNLKIYSNSLFLHYYTIHITVIPEPPTIIQGEVYESRTASFPFEGTAYYTFSASSSKVKISTASNSFTLEGVTPGDVNIYLKDRQGIHRYTYKITVKAKPQAQVYNLDFYAGEYGEINLPENIEAYNFYVTNESFFAYQNIHGVGNKITFQAGNPGETTLYLYEKTGYQFEKYIINLRVSAVESSHTLHVSDKVIVGYTSEKRSYVTQSGESAYISKIDGRAHATGIIPGETVVNEYSDGIHIQVYYITVLPKPDPIELTCSTETGQECNFQIKSDYLTVSQSRDGVVEINEKASSFEVNAIKSGTAQIQVKSWKGDYISYIITITVNPRSVIVYDVETPLGISIVSDWNSEYESSVYTLAVSNPGIVSSNFDQYFVGSGEASFKQLRLRFQGLQEGHTEVYLYKYGDHTATIKIKVLPPVPRISINSQVNIDLLEGEQITFDILSGGGGYTEGEYKPEQIDFYVDSDFGSSTGSVSIEAKKILSGEPNQYSFARIVDRYHQVLDLKVTVEDANMLLSTANLQLNGGDTEFINIYNAFKGIKSIYKSNYNISATKGVTEEGLEYIIVKGQEKGVTILEIEDYEGTIRTVEVVVGGGGVTDTSTTGGIRYIRDWANGSSSNAGSHWIEIQALEKGTNINIAEGKNVTGKKNEPNPQRPYSWIVDGDTAGSRRAEGGVGENYALIDLGEIYDISTVKIWHYYPDGRSYYGTKTEVSADGITWTTLFDSAVSGIYVEPVDGIGRSYDVPGIDTLPSNTGGIRYIKDWASGSNKNAGSHWVEIEAFEKGTGVNVARGKKIIGYGTEVDGQKQIDAGRPLGRITDGSINTGARTFSHEKRIAVDLGAVYDIGTIKVLHYYHDGRIYNGTKTEVSADGITWTTLFDSAVSGTYAEPTDGSGRTYTVTGYDQLPSETDALQYELETELIDIFAEFGIEINSVEEEGVAINSAEYASRCELGSTGEYWTRPEKAVCLNNADRIAWTCTTGYEDVSYIDGTNTCVKKEYTGFVTDSRYRDLRDRLRVIVRNKNISSDKASLYIDTFTSKRGKLFEKYSTNSQVQSLALYLYDDLINEFDKKVDAQRNDYFEIVDYFRAMQFSANSGRGLSTYSTNGETYNTIYLPEYGGKSRIEIEAYTQVFYEKLFAYEMQYNSEYRNSFYAQATEIKNQGGGTQEEIEKGLKEGIIEGGRDYVMAYYDAVKNLQDIKIEHLFSGLDKAWSIIKSPVESTQNAVEFVKVESAKLFDKLLVLTGYEVAKGTTYVGTNLGLSAVDPAGKILTLAGGSFFIKIADKVNQLIWTKPLGLGHTGRYIPNDLSEKLALEQAMKNPVGGKELPVTMTDSRWPGTDGWVKMSQNINGIEIHYVLNKITNQIDDFKFKD